MAQCTAPFTAVAESVMNHPVRLATCLLFALISPALACGGTVESSNQTTGGSGGAGASAGSGGTTSTGGSVGKGGSGGTCAPAPCPYPATWDSQTCQCVLPDAGPPVEDASVDAPLNALKMSITAIEMWVFCMPEVPPDTLHGSFMVHYDNSLGTTDASASITHAEWTLSGPYTFDVQPKDSGIIPAGSVADIVYTKVAGSGKGTGDPCAACNGMGVLHLTLDVGGQSVSISKVGAPNCSY